MREILEKAEKLLNLAKRGGTEHEADTAMRKLQALLVEHNLSIEDVEIGCDPITEETAIMSGARRGWRDFVAKGAAELLFCVALKRGAALVFIGKRSNIAAAKALTTYLIEHGEARADEELMKGLTLDARHWKRSFLLGYAGRILERCEELRLSKEPVAMSDGTEIILHPLYSKEGKEVSDWIQENLKVKTPKAPRFASVDRDAHLQGDIEGRQVSLSHANLEE